MNKTVSCIFCFLLGATAGAIAMRFAIKKKYEQIANDEIESVKEVFKKRQSHEDNTEPEKNDIMELKTIAQEHKYNYADCDVETTPNDSAPYVISPEEYADTTIDGYDSATLIYYSDNILATDDDKVVSDIEDTIGEESLARFGDYEDDCVYVRNPVKKCDYEVLKDNRRYIDVVQTEDEVID